MKKRKKSKYIKVRSHFRRTKSGEKTLVIKHRRKIGKKAKKKTQPKQSKPSEQEYTKLILDALQKTWYSDDFTSEMVDKLKRKDLLLLLLHTNRKQENFEIYFDIETKYKGIVKAKSPNHSIVEEEASTCELENFEDNFKIDEIKITGDWECPQMNFQTGKDYATSFTFDIIKDDSEYPTPYVFINDQLHLLYYLEELREWNKPIQAAIENNLISKKEHIKLARNFRNKERDLKGDDLNQTGHYYDDTLTIIEQERLKKIKNDFLNRG